MLINAYSSITANGYNTVNGYTALTINDIILHHWMADVLFVFVNG